MNRGYIKFWRKAQDSSSWNRGLMYQGLIINLLSRAAWKKGSYQGRDILPGQFGVVMSHFAESLGVPRSTLQRMVAHLEADDFIKVENMGNRFAVITIVNWGIYQESEKDAGQPVGNRWAPNGQPMGNPSIRKEKVKKEEEESSLRSDSSRPRSDEPDVQAKPKKSRTPLPELAEDSEAYRLAVYMRDQLAEVLPTFKEPTLQSWARDFDVALRNDERMGDVRFVAQVIKWVAADSFWRTNCQCPATLRKQFDKLTARMAEEAAKARASPPGIVAAGGRPIATTQYQKDRQSSENIAKLYLTLKSQEQTNGNENEHSAGAVFDVPCLSTAHG